MKPGDRLHDRFELVEPIGTGGVATVWRAKDGAREVALKVLHPHLRGDAVVAERFRREVAVLRGIAHPAIVKAHELFDGDDALFFSMDLLKGGTLKDRIRAAGPLEATEAVRVTKEILSGLAAAHAAGVVHRDLNPRNVFVCEDGSVRLLDFGFARVDLAAGLTRKSLVLCTPEYASPELIAGRPVDGRADLYALGAVLFEALTGHPPFAGGSPFELLRRQTSEPPPRVRASRPSVPEPLDALVGRLLSKGPEDRPATCEETILLLEKPAKARAEPAGVCPACRSPREEGWPLCPACGAAGNAAERGPWMVVLLRVPGGADGTARLRDAVRSVGASPGHELAIGSDEATATLPAVVVKGVNEPLARLLRERCLEKDLQVELRRTDDDNLDLLHRSRPQGLAMIAALALGWLALLGGALLLWRGSWHAGWPALAGSSGLVGLVLALGFGANRASRSGAHRLLPPLATVERDAAPLALPGWLVERYQAALRDVREEALRGTLRRLLEHALSIQAAAAAAPDHMKGVLEPARAAALDLVAQAAELATAAQARLDSIDRLPESDLWDARDALRARLAAAPPAARPAIEEELLSKERALAELEELERSHAATRERLNVVAAAVELAAIRLAAASAPDAPDPAADLERLAVQGQAAVRTARELARS